MSSTILKALCLYGGLIAQISKFCGVEEAVSISNYAYPRPNNNEGDLYRIAIFGTNDIHGAAFPLSITHPISGEKYNYGGLEYMASYINILREEWGDRFMYLDGGDQFQGAIESSNAKGSKGAIMTDFYRAMKLSASAIGNHEFDDGQDSLKEDLGRAEGSWEYLSANMYDKTTNEADFMTNTKSTNIFQVGDVKVGVIGLTTIETPRTTSGDLTNIGFWEYHDLVVAAAASLREEGANAIILNTHVGMYCRNQDGLKKRMNIWSPKVRQIECEQTDEMVTLLNALPEGTVDAVVAGHRHDIAHHFINGVPVIQNINGGYYAHVLYLAFDKATKKVVKDKNLIEGPLPICEKIFSKSRTCQNYSAKDAAHIGDLTPFSFHNKVIEGDKKIKELFAPWWEEVKKYKVTIGETEVELVRGREKENPLGNLVADMHKKVAGSDFAIINDGSMRTTWFPGAIQIDNLFGMFPFNNQIQSFEMTGEEILQMLTIVQAGNKSFYHTSGFAMKLEVGPHKFVSATKYDGTAIEDDVVYTVASNDFIVNGGDDFATVKTTIAGFPKNVQSFTQVRDEMINYIKEIGTLKLEDMIDPEKPRMEIVNTATKKRNLKEN